MKINPKFFLIFYFVLIYLNLPIKAQLLPIGNLETNTVMDMSKLYTAEVGDDLKLNDYSFKASHRIGLSDDETYTFYTLKTVSISRPIVVIIDNFKIKETNYKTGQICYSDNGHNRIDHDLTYKLQLFYQRKQLKVVQLFELIKGQQTKALMFSNK